MEKQEVLALTAIDLSAVFDTVDHELLLQVLKRNFGVTGSALGWFDSYLRPRWLKVTVGKAYSSSCDLSFTVPQGSCVGPVLFLAYASTIQTIVPAPIKLYGYADDHALSDLFKASDRVSESETIARMPDLMKDIKGWMDSNRLKMNDDKMEFIMFGNHVQLQKCHTCHLDFMALW